MASTNRPLRAATIVHLAVACLAHPLSAQALPDPRRLDLSVPLTYYIAEGSPDSGFREGDRALAEQALRAWVRLSNHPVRLVPGSEASSTIRLYWVSAEGGLYGEMRARLVGGRRAADIFVNPDTDGLGPDIGARARQDPLFRETIVYLTCVHELGHVFGLPHTDAFADIMYSFQYGGDFVAYFDRFRRQLESVGEVGKASPFSAADVATFRALYP